MIAAVLAILFLVGAVALFVAFARLRDGSYWEWPQFATFWTGVLLTLLFVPFALGATVAHIQTHEGESFGYITAVETGGVMFTTTTVYVKTDLETTQEDTYCVEDRAVADQLRHAAETGQRVRLTFTEHLWWSAGCTWDDGTTIRSVSVIEVDSERGAA